MCSCSRDYGTTEWIDHVGFLSFVFSSAFCVKVCAVEHKPQAKQAQERKEKKVD